MSDKSHHICQTYNLREKAILIVYFDDIILTGDHHEEIVKSFMAKEFEIKDLGTLRYFLRMQIARSIKGSSVS